VAGTEESLAADALCLGYGLVPSVELLRLAGCDFEYDEDRGGPVVVLDRWMRTSVPRISAAGDGTGVEGSAVAIDEGRLAALGAALDLGALPPATAERASAPMRRRLARKRALRRALRQMHAVGPGVHGLAGPDTVVCRCEEVTAGELDAAIEGSADPGVVKGLTRAGMGMCQGRNCERHVAARIAARHGVRIADVLSPTPRPPVRPVPLAAIADDTVGAQVFFVESGTET
jgi:NAD(P)H-nitrite reductase large subunit